MKTETTLRPFLRGWCWPEGCNEPHYFVGTQPLCGRVGPCSKHAARYDTLLVIAGDCTECAARLHRRRREPK